MVGTPAKLIAAGIRHSFEIYRDPKILDEIPTTLTWDDDQLNQYQPLQQHYDDRRWDSRFCSTEPGHFGSDYEYQLYRLLQLQRIGIRYLLLSNVPLRAIISVDRNTFEKWYAQKNFLPGALEDAFGEYSRLVGKKVVDLIVVSKKTGRIISAIEVDGNAHETDPFKIQLDYAKNYNFRIVQIPLLRISVDSVMQLWRTAPIDGHKDRFLEAFKKMHAHWDHFVSDPTEQNMHLHFTDPIVPPKCSPVCSSAANPLACEPDADEVATPGSRP